MEQRSVSQNEVKSSRAANVTTQRAVSEGTTRSSARDKGSLYDSNSQPNTPFIPRAIAMQLAKPKVAFIICVAFLGIHGVEHMLSATEWPIEADPVNIVRRSRLIAHGASPLDWPDPPLRYLPISALILVGELIGISATITTTVYSGFFEFVVVPAVVYFVTSRWFSQISGVCALYLLAGMNYLTYPHSSPIWWQTGFWMYAYTLPSMLLSFYFAEKINKMQRYVIYTGVLLGVTAMLEIFMAGVAAVIVAITLSYKRKIKELFVVGGLSMIIASPMALFYLEHSEYWLGEGGGRIAEAPSLHWWLTPSNPKGPELILTWICIAGVIAGIIHYRQKVPLDFPNIVFV